MFSEAVWSLVMAVNVYLVVFRSYDSDVMKRLEKWYLLVWYGVPFIPAFIFCFVNDSAKGRMFGDATVSISLTHYQDMSADIFQIWCWISAKWGIARIVSVYVWIWYIFPLHLDHFSVTSC